MSHQLLALQQPDGGFRSVMTSRDGAFDDRNSFTTALVVRLIRRAPDEGGLVQLRERALDFLMTCASPVVPGAFAFWPERTRPAWAPRVPPDVDDTVIIVTEMMRYGRVDRLEAVRRFCEVVLPHRVRESDGVRPPWVATGSFYTWIAPPGAASYTAANIVDACVNANVAALMAFMNARHLPGYNEAVTTVLEAVRWAGSDPRRLSAITPFYPTLQGLIEAIEHAVDCGVDALGHAADHLTALVAAGNGIHTGEALCCRSAYGATLWRCEAVAAARALAHSSIQNHVESHRVPHRTS